MHALPGGIVEYGETVEECVVREIEEETGLKTRVLDLVGVYSAADRDPQGSLHHIGVQPDARSAAACRGGDDAAEAALFPLESLPVMAADHRMILSDALLKRDQYRSRYRTSRPVSEGVRTTIAHTDVRDVANVL